MPFVPQLPLPDVLYRIQNMDYGYFLELPDENVDSKWCVARLEKERNEQYWKFIPDPGNPLGFKIISAAKPNLFLGHDKTLTVLPTDEASGILWNIEIPRDNDYCSIKAPNPKGGTLKYYMQLDAEGNTKVAMSGRNVNQQWRIIEVSGTPSLSHDIYRISNIDGVSTLTIRDNSLALYTEELGKDEGWELFPKGNAKFEIKKKEGDQYLASENGKITIVTKPVIWKIRSFGGFAYTVTTETEDLALALTDYNEIVLEPKSGARSQAWFFEPTKFILELEELEADRRFSQFPSGEYHLQSYDTQKYVGCLTNPLRASPQDAKNDDSTMVITYVNETSPYFTIKSAGKGLGGYFVSWNDLFVMSDVPVTWYLDRDGDNPGYYICAAGNDRIPQVLSSVTRKDLNGSTMYTIGDRTPETRGQMWKLIKS